MDGINLGKHDRREPHILLKVMGIFNGEDGKRMHLLPLVNVGLLRIRIHMCLERLVHLLKEEGKNNCNDFCDMEVYMLYAAAIESVFQMILVEILDS